MIRILGIKLKFAEFIGTVCSLTFKLCPLFLCPFKDDCSESSPKDTHVLCAFLCSRILFTLIVVFYVVLCTRYIVRRRKLL